MHFAFQHTGQFPMVEVDVSLHSVRAASVSAANFAPANSQFASVHHYILVHSAEQACLFLRETVAKITTVHNRKHEGFSV